MDGPRLLSERVNPIRFGAVTFVAGLAAVPLAAGEPPAKPNAVFIVTNDCGHRCAANGVQSYKTPHLDRLAKDGVWFEHCHVQPLWTPTCVQLMTGRYNVLNHLNFGTLVRPRRRSRT